MKYNYYRRIYVILLIMPMLALSACSTAKKIPEYTGSHLLPPLEVPPDLDSPAFNERMRIPDSSVATKGATRIDMPRTITPATPSIEEPPVFLEEE